MPQTNRPTLIARLTERPQDEAWLWTLYAAMALVALFGHPGSLLISLPIGVYLFWSRQRAARVRAQAEQDAVAARADQADEPTSTGRRAR